MPNTRVLRGAQATLNLASQDNREGNSAGAIVNDEYDISTVGRVTGVEVHIQTELETFHEMGKRHPVSLHPGNIHVTGQVERAYVNGALLRLLLGDMAEGSPSVIQRNEELQPAFNMIIDVSDESSNDGITGTKITVEGMQFENWSVVVPEDDFVMENVTFKGLRVIREEKE